jgi:hypothetical protein
MSDIEANKAIVRRYFETFNAGSPTAVHPMCVLKDRAIRSDLAGAILL